MKQLAVRLLVGLLCPVVGFAVAADAEPLTEGKVRGFVQSMVDLHALGKKYEDVPINVAPAQGGDVGQMFSRTVTALEGHPGYREFEAVIRNHGFRDPHQWAAVGNRVMLAFVALVSEEQQPEIDRQMAEALAQIDQSDLSEQQKTAMREMLGASKQMASAMQNVPEADKRAVRPSIDDIKAWEKLK